MDFMTFYITKVHLDDPNNEDTKAIVECKVIDPFGDEITQTKDEICDAIENECLTYRVKFGLKPEVHVFPLSGERWLRSDKNDTDKDNLLELPRY